MTPQTRELRESLDERGVPYEADDWMDEFDDGFMTFMERTVVGDVEAFVSWRIEDERKTFDSMGGIAGYLELVVDGESRIATPDDVLEAL